MTIHSSYGHVLVLLHRVPNCLGCLLVAIQHLIIPLFHLKVNLRDLVLIVLPQLSAIYLQSTLLDHTCHFLFIILELLFFDLI